MLLVTTLLQAAPESVIKTSYTEFYDKGEFIFSIIQEWELTHQTGDPTPLPMVTREYIYAEKTGLELIFTKTNGKTVFDNQEWLLEEKWQEFVVLNSIPIELYVYKDASVIVRQDLEAESDYAWYLNSENAWCEFNEDKCQPKSYNFEYKFERKLPCIDFDVWWCDSLGITDFEPYWDEVYVNNKVADIKDTSTVFTSKIDLTNRTVITGADGSGVKPFISIH